MGYAMCYNGFHTNIDREQRVDAAIMFQLQK